jgi:cytoskeleton protein RodZ
MAGEGVLLRKAREKKGWSYHDVEDSIKIRARYLEALENEEYAILPGVVYTKGFLRTYCKYLGLNSEEIINLYNFSLAKEPPPELHSTLTPIQSTPVWFKPIVIVAMALFAVLIVIGITYLSKANSGPQVSDYTPTPLPTAPETQNNPINPGQDSAQPAEELPAKYEGIVAELIFKENCWLKIRVDGIIVQNGMSYSGTNKILEGKERIEFLTIGNAGGFTLKLNGKEVPPLGVSGEVVRNYIVTEEIVQNL